MGEEIGGAMVFRSQREELSTEAILFFAAVYRSKYDRKTSCAPREMERASREGYRVEGLGGVGGA